MDAIGVGGGRHNHYHVDLNTLNNSDNRNSSSNSNTNIVTIIIIIIINTIGTNNASGANIEHAVIIISANRDIDICKISLYGTHSTRKQYRTLLRPRFG